MTITPGIRLWKEDASETTDYLAPGVAYSAADLGLTPGSPLTLKLDAQPGFISSVIPLTATANITTADHWNGTLDDTSHSKLSGFDVDIDADNDEGLYQGPTRDAAEEAVEGLDSGAKVVLVNRDDTDGDRVPDYADGYSHFGGSSDSVNRERMTPMVLQLPLDLLDDASITFTYEASDPAAVTRAEHTVAGLTGDLATAYSYDLPAEGLIRLWRDSGSPSSRSVTDFVANDTPYTAAELGITSGNDGELTLYIEAVRESPAPTLITVQFDHPDLAQPMTQSVKVLPLGPKTADTGLAVNEIEGYTIVNTGSQLTGTTGNDIILGTPFADAINGNGGDDIVFAGGAQGGQTDQIDVSGSGASVVFASVGFTEITKDNLDELRDVLRPSGDAAWTTEQLVGAYKVLYGDDDPWLETYFAVGGTVKAAANNWYPGDIASRWTFGPEGRVGGYTGWEIVIEQDFGKVFEAAGKLRELIMTGAAVHVREFEDIFFSKLATSSLNEQYQGEFDSNLQNYQAIRQAKLAEAINVSSTIANAYLASVGIVSEAADLLITLDEVSQGNYAAAFGLLPGVPAYAFKTAGAGGKLFVAFDGTKLVEYVGKRLDDALAVPIYKAIDGQSGLAVKVTKTVEETARPVDAAGGRKVMVYGKGHAADDHRFAIDSLATQKAQTADAEYVTANLELRTTLHGTDGRLAVPDHTTLSLKPDVVVVRRDGKIDLYEIISESDDTPLGRDALVNKIGQMKAYLELHGFEVAEASVLYKDGRQHYP